MHPSRVGQWWFTQDQQHESGKKLKASGYNFKNTVKMIC